jgi:hypothetical protein
MRCKGFKDHLKEEFRGAVSEIKKFRFIMHLKKLIFHIFKNSPEYRRCGAIAFHVPSSAVSFYSILLSFHKLKFFSSFSLLFFCCLVSP